MFALAIIKRRLFASLFPFHDRHNYTFDFFMQGNGDRAYKVETQGGTKEVFIAARIVYGLTQLNSEQKRTMRHYDKPYLKALLVSLIGVRQLKEEGVDKDTLKLIKGMLHKLQKILRKNQFLLIDICFIYSHFHNTD